MLPATNKSWPPETSAMTCQTLTLPPMSRKNLNKLATPYCEGESYAPAALTSNSLIAVGFQRLKMLRGSVCDEWILVFSACSRLSRNPAFADSLPRVRL